jgi:hypothetical protein
VSSVGIIVFQKKSADFVAGPSVGPFYFLQNPGLFQGLSTEM